jgi:hypothetical protein
VSRSQYADPVTRWPRAILARSAALAPSSGRLVTACPDFLAGQRAVEGTTADGMDQDADRVSLGAMIRRRSGCGLPPSLARTSCGRSAA